MTTTITASNMEALKQLMEQDPALLEDLRGSSSRQEFTHKLATVAQAQGLTIDETELGQVMDAAFDTYAENPELTDEQLENVTGGVVIGGAIAMSLGAKVAMGAGVAIVVLGVVGLCIATGVASHLMNKKR